MLLAGWLLLIGACFRSCVPAPAASTGLQGHVPDLVHPAYPCLPQPNTTCVGIVWQPSAEGQDEQEASASASRRRRRGKHPRRTQMVRPVAGRW